MQTISEPESEKIAVFRGVKNRQLTGSDVPEQGRTRDISLGWQEPDPEAIYNWEYILKTTLREACGKCNI